MLINELNVCKYFFIIIFMKYTHDEKLVKKQHLTYYMIKCMLIKFWRNKMIKDNLFINRDEAIVYVIGNFKGGVGKSKTVEMLSYDSALFKRRRTLVIDLDPQGNASSVLLNTANIDSYSKTIYDAILENDITNAIIPVMENLDVVVADKTFSKFPQYAYTNFENEIDQVSILNNLIKDIKNQYDAIYIDVPPTISIYSDNAIIASDYVIIVLQTQTKSLEGANNYIEYMNLMIKNFDINLEVAGIIPYMMQKRSNVDQTVLSVSKEMYGDFLLDTIVHYQERLKMYDLDGISYNLNKNGKLDQWDEKAHRPFCEIIDELDYHILSYEKNIGFSDVQEYIEHLEN